MGWMEFTSSVVGSLVWPACVFLIVLFLRRGLTNMLTSGPLKALKAGPTGFELEYFDRTLTDAKLNTGLPPGGEFRQFSEVDHFRLAIPAPSAKSIEPEPDAYGGLRELAALAPAAAILEAFGRLEKTLRDKLDPVIGEPNNLGPIRTVAGYAKEHGILTSAEIRALNDLATLRDALSHGEGRDVVDRYRALSYIAVATKLINRIENVTVQEPAPKIVEESAPRDQQTP